MYKNSNNALQIRNISFVYLTVTTGLGYEIAKVIIRWFWNMTMHHLSQSDVQSDFKSLNELYHIPCFFNFFIINVRGILEITVIIAKIVRIQSQL